MRLHSIVIVCALACAWVIVSSATQVPASVPARGDEFVGPFNSWKDARRSYGAAGDGTTDDTAALQRGLDDLVTVGHAPVLYLPRGTYRITRTLTLAPAANVNLIGEDPDRTRLVWDGAMDGTMLGVSGVEYSRVSRLTFDGRGKALAAVEQAWDGKRGFFDTGNEYSDVRFIDVGYGVHGGFLGGGFAETSIMRAQFIRNTRAGLALGNFNALDVWVWDSLFEDCTIGVTNDPGAGNFRVYDSVFRRSRQTDLRMLNTGLFTARGNYSAGSRRFYHSAAIGHPAIVDIQHNVIVDTTEATAIQLGNQGPGLLLDNVIRSASSATAPAVVWNGLNGADVVSVGNTFSVGRPITANGRLVAIDDRVVPRASLDVREPSLLPTRPHLGRPVIEVPSGATGSAIQDAITAAVRLSGRRPVVHIPFGSYAISETLNVPASDVQIVGDGYGTKLRWTGAGAGPLFAIHGPTRATLREMHITGTTSVDGIVIDGVDQRGSSVYLEGVQLRSGEASNLLIDGLRETRVQLVDFGHGYAPRGSSLKIVGPPTPLPDEAIPAKTIVFSGASSGNRISHDVSGGATLIVRDVWYEATTPGYADIHGRANFTVQGSRISTKTNEMPPAIVLRDLDGRATLLTAHLDDRIVVSGNGARASVLGLGLLREFQRTPFVTHEASPLARTLFVNVRQRPETTSFLGPGSLPVPDTASVDAAFVKRMLADARADPSPRLQRPASGASDVRLFRIWVTGSRNNVTVTGH